MKENLANKANHIIAVSQNTKKDIINIFGIKENKISVIYHSTSLHSKEGVIKVPEKFILYVGDRHAGYKNFKFMVRAVSSILKEYKELNVVCLGHDFDVNERELLRNLGVSNRFISMFASEDLISEIYCKALFLLYPSYYEGFGIPILEAFALSCPVLLSDIYCFREIAKDAGFYFNAKDIVDLREKISVLLVDKDIRKRMIVNGLSRSSDFSWIKSTEQTVAVYKNLYERFS
jgi:glycosyltransferase involved in cell wall biosynthesis